MVSAVILAAGMGKRMGARGQTSPKGLIEIAGQPIITHSLKALRANGVDQITIVTGYRAADYHAKFNEDHSVRFVHNPDFAVSGSAHSLAIALSHVEDSIVLLESDIVYSETFLRKLLAEPRVAKVLVSDFTHSQDEVWVSTDKHGVLNGLTKDFEKVSNLQGEFVGISYLPFSHVEILLENRAELFSNDFSEDYESTLVKLSKLAPIHCKHVEGLAWGEVDNEDHLSRVEQQVLPRLALNLPSD